MSIVAGAPEGTTRRVKRLRRTPEEARRLILETAQSLIASTGPERLRLQDIAAGAGISHSLILHHFGSREGLVRALTRQATPAAALAQAQTDMQRLLDRVGLGSGAATAQR